MAEGENNDQNFDSDLQAPESIDNFEQNQAGAQLDSNRNLSIASGQNAESIYGVTDNRFDLGHGDIASEGTLEELSDADQSKRAADLEKERVKRQDSNARADRLNSAVGGVNMILAVKNRKKINDLQKKIKTGEKEKNEKNNKLQTDLKQKAKDLRTAKSKVLAQIIRIVIEAFSGIGIPVAVWEAIKLAYKNSEIKKLKDDQEKIRGDIKNNETEFDKTRAQYETQIYNLSMVFKREAEPN